MISLHRPSLSFWDTEGDCMKTERERKINQEHSVSKHFRVAQPQMQALWTSHVCQHQSSETHTSNEMCCETRECIFSQVRNKLSSLQLQAKTARETVWVNLRETAVRLQLWQIGSVDYFSWHSQSLTSISRIYINSFLPTDNIFRHSLGLSATEKLFQ